MNNPLAVSEHNRGKLPPTQAFRLPNLVPVGERGQKILAHCLAFTAGYMDGYGLLVLGIYVSFVSGNTTMAGVKAGQESFLAALAPAIAIVSFVGGSLVGTLITHARVRH